MYYYGARWYDPALGRFVQPDSIVPGVGESGNPDAVGYLGAATYSPLTVDYHENQLLDELNTENWARFQDSNFKLPPVPTNSIAFDRYAYSLDNPIRYTDPSGHCPFCVPFILTLGAITPAGWVAIGVTAVGVGLYFAVPGIREAVTNGIYETGEAASNGLNALFARKKDLGFIDHLLDKYGINDKKVRESIHRQISGQHYTDEEIEDIVAGEAELVKKPEKKETKK